MNRLTAPQFPAGEFVPPGDYDHTARVDFIGSIEAFPEALREEVISLENGQLDTRYRNWTIRQIVHHVADSHINCYVRFKWALTEETPTIKSYNESLWSEVADATSSPVTGSLTILDGVHQRWGQLMRLMTDQQWSRGFFHPEMDRVVTLAEALPSYVWHGQHHLAQIRWVKQQHDW